MNEKLEKPAPAPVAAEAPAPSRLAGFDRAANAIRILAQPEERELRSAAVLAFDVEGAPKVTGSPVAGGELVVRYHPNRSPLKLEVGGRPAWGVQAFVEFQPGGEVFSAPAIAFSEVAGELVGPPQSAPIVVPVPRGAAMAVVYFQQWMWGDRPQEAWDSNWGRNYLFAIAAW